MTNSEKESAKEAKVAARSLFEVQNIVRSILKQSIKYIRTDAYIIWRMAEIVNDSENEFNPF
jgi:hypothetical protein